MRTAIIGGGFGGICAVHNLTSKTNLPCENLTLIDAGSALGGILNPVTYDGFSLDRGVHFFDSISTELADFLTDCVGGKATHVTFKAKSKFNGEVTENFGLPDFSSLDPESLTLVRSELQALNDSYDGKAFQLNEFDGESLRDLFDAKFGKILSEHLDKVFTRIYGLNAKDADFMSTQATSFGRAKFGDDAMMSKIKSESKFLDSVVAKRRSSSEIESGVGADGTVTIYPRTGDGMSTLLSNLEMWMVNRGINLKLKTKIIGAKQLGEVVRLYLKNDSEEYHLDFEKVIWTAQNWQNLCDENKNSLNNYNVPVPMKYLYIFCPPELINGDMTYGQNFDQSAVSFRSCGLGPLSGQVVNGLTYISCEIPNNKFSVGYSMNDEDLYKRAIDELLDFQIIKDRPREKFKILSTPVSFPVKKVGWNFAKSQAIEELENLYPQVSVPKGDLFFKKDIFSYYQNVELYG